jgi:hypothetical protein
MMAGMDSQFIANLIAGISAFAAIASAIFAGRQAISSKEAKAKADEAHKAALDMRDAAQRSAKAAEEQVRQAKESLKAAKKQARQAEKSLKQMQQIVSEQQSQSVSQSKIAANLWRPKFQLTHVQGLWYKLCNTTGSSIEVLGVANHDQFLQCDPIHKVFSSGESLNICIYESAEYPLPANLELRINGQADVVSVPIPR